MRMLSEKRERLFAEIQASVNKLVNERNTVSPIRQAWQVAHIQSLLAQVVSAGLAEAVWKEKYPMTASGDVESGGVSVSGGDG